MQIITSLESLPMHLSGAIVAIGNFDGVHLGHQQVIQQAIAFAHEQGRAAGVLTFSPHPRQILSPDCAPFRLSRDSQRSALFAALGVDAAYILPFTQTFADYNPTQFVEHILVEKLQVGGVVVGYDFVFGCKRQGNTKTLEHLGLQHGFNVHMLDPVYDGARHLYSSSSIRHALREGRLDMAAEGLGRPWEVSGVVINGDQRGRTIGFPTANIAMDDYVALKHGVYQVTVQLPDGGWHAGIANIGVRPTVQHGTTPLLEVHLLHFSGDLYGQTLQVRFQRFLRPEQQFASLEALKEQIVADIALLQHHS